MPINLREQAFSTGKVSRLFSISLAIVLFALLGSASHISLPAHASSLPLKQATFKVDAVTVTVQSAFLPGVFHASKPGDPDQQAVAKTSDPSIHPQAAFYVIVAPYGTRTLSEGIPTGSAATYRATLHQYRVNSGYHPYLGPTVTLFGQKIQGEVSLMLSSDNRTSTAVVEWVVEAGKRLWIVRVTQEQLATTITTPLLSQLASLVMTSSTLSQSTTVNLHQLAVTPNTPSSNIDHLPSWWNGEMCDKTNFYNATGTNPFELGTQHFHALYPCGPLPIQGGAQACTSFGGIDPCPDAESEWQCVELSMRYLYIGYNQAPYYANGWQVVNNYPGTALVKVRPGVGQKPLAGDIMALGDGTGGDPSGHTGIVLSSSINSQGNGSVVLLDQNDVLSGTTTLNVSNWVITTVGWPSNLTANGWLHDPSGGNSSSASANSTYVGQNANGTLQAFGWGTDNNIWTSSQTASNALSWNQWTPPQSGFAFNGSPVVGTFNGTLQVFVRGTSNAIWHLGQNTNGTWGQWQVLQSNYAFQGLPAIGNDPNGSIDVFARGGDNNIWHDVYNTSSNSWNGWMPLQSGTSFNGDPTVGVYRGTLQVFARGSSNAIWHIGQNADGSWGQWAALQSNYTFQGTPATATDAQGNIDVFARGSDNNIWYDSYTVSSQNWNGWTPLQSGNSFNGDIAVGVYQGTLQVFARGSSNAIWHIGQNADGSWSQWAALQSSYTFQGTPAVANDVNGNIEVFGWGGDNNIWRDAYTMSSGSWSGWTPLYSGYTFKGA